MFNGTQLPFQYHFSIKQNSFLGLKKSMFHLSLPPPLEITDLFTVFKLYSLNHTACNLPI